MRERLKFPLSSPIIVFLALACQPLMISGKERIEKSAVSSKPAGRVNWLWPALFTFAAIGLSVFYLLHDFRGLPMSQAMDQAQIGREILRGHGWQTKFIRPLGIGELRRHGKDVSAAIQYDTYDAPIPPLLDAAALFIPIHAHWDLTELGTVYAGDRAIAFMGVMFFLASLFVLYRIALELFDQRLAFMATGLVLICDTMWNYSLSGLPQMFLLLLLNLKVWAILRAIRARHLNKPHLWWAAAVGAGFGLMALTHALSIFIFLPVLAFTFLSFRPHGRAGVVMLAVFLAIYSPWLVRNAMVCGDFRGLAGFSGLDGVVHRESGHMRRMAIDLGGASISNFARNFRANLSAQISRIIEYMGWSFIAPLALVSVFHTFRRPLTATFRWLLFAMWGSTVCGMAIFGMKEEHSLAANQFHLLFLPLFICYGLAYLLILWDRRFRRDVVPPNAGDPGGFDTLGRSYLIAGIFIVSGIPVLSGMLLDRNRATIEWPPYVPPSIASLRDFTTPGEIIGSDVPWAVAWYADRRSLWLPFDPPDLLTLSDSGQLGAPIVGLYFTPVSGTQNLFGDLLNGEYQHWTRFVVRSVDLAYSPYPFMTFPGMPDCTLYMDRDRRQPQSQTTKQPPIK
jgi:hypothetical protein